MKQVKKWLAFFMSLVMAIGVLSGTGLEVKADTNNTVTIYYSTFWSTAKIHYRVGNGSWTSVPGVSMTKATDQSGYNYKYTVDLGSSTSLTFCFNNGNGSWDS